MTANICLWPGYVNPKDVVLRAVPCVHDVLIVRRSPFEAPLYEGVPQRRRALPNSTDAPPVTRRSPTFEDAPPEPLRRQLRQLPDSVDDPPTARTPRWIALETFAPELVRRLVLPPPSVIPPRPPPRRRRRSGGGGWRPIGREIVDLEDLSLSASDAEDLDSRANAFWARRKTPRSQDAADAFAELRRRLIARDESQAAIIGALTQRLERETALARVLWLAAASGVATALITKKPMPTLVALALATAVGRLVFQPAPLRVYLWVTAPNEAAPSRVLSEPVVLTESEAAHVTRELGPGALQLEFTGHAWMPARGAKRPRS